LVGNDSLNYDQICLRLIIITYDVLHYYHHSVVLYPPNET
jgi:hypothetical protein